jgi:hypothetical protein
MLNETIGTQTLNRIQMHDRVVLFEKRPNFMTMIIATKYLASLEIWTNQFTDRFEELFGSILPTWSGNTQVFFPAESLTDIHFLLRNLK